MLLALGPSAAAHASVSDTALLARWVEEDLRGTTLDNGSKTAWLQSAVRLLQTASGEEEGEAVPAAPAASSFPALVVQVAERWAAAGTDDSGVLAAALEALAIAQGGPSAFRAVVPVVKSQAMAASAVRLLGTKRPPEVAAPSALTPT